MPKKQRKKKITGQQKKFLLVGLVIVLVVILPVYFIFFRGALTFALDPDWHVGASGYRDALRESRNKFQPILVVVNEERCRKCEILKDQMWKNREFHHALENIILVQLNISRNTNDLRIAKQLGFTRAPSLFLLPAYNASALPIHVLPDLNSIWVPGRKAGSGYHAPISSTSFRLAVDLSIKYADEILLEKNN